MLNKDQINAVTAPMGSHLLIVAGAGTGKTKALAHRFAHLVKKGVPARKLCAITFTNKAAGELEARVGTLLGGSAQKAGFVGTFHSLGARILRREARLVKRTPDFVIFDENDSLSLLKKTLKQNPLALKKGPAYLKKLISSFKSLGPNGNSSQSFDQSTLAAVYAYERELEEHNAFDFDDLLQKTVALFSGHLEIREKYQRAFSHILVDEYQDVNDIQHALLALLAAPETVLSAVGDAEQTIYSFRGSNIRIFLDFPSHWKNPSMVTLTQNYRSTKTILAAAGSVISKNRYDTTVSRATDLWTENEDGEPIALYAAKNDSDEAGWVVDKIGNWKLEIGNSTAILYRTNAQSRAIEQALIGADIPYRIYGGIKFYERREVKDIIAALRLVLNPRDTLSRERLEKGITKRRFLPYWNVLHNSPREPRGAITFFLEKTHYLQYLEDVFLNAEERHENIEELLRFAETFESLPLFLERVALLQSTDDKVSGITYQGPSAIGQKSDNAENTRYEVQLMTIHLAKGLEFDRVFVVGCTEGILPHARSMQSEGELQEERRLMYVAMTRAKKNLALSFYDIPSRFLGEIPKECVTFESSDGGSYDDLDESGYEERWIEF